MSEVQIKAGLMVRTLCQLVVRSFQGEQKTVEANAWGFLDRANSLEEHVWMLRFGDDGAALTVDDLRDSSRFELRDEPALPPKDGSSIVVAANATLELETSDWPLHIHGSGSAYQDGCGLIAKFDLPTGSVGDDQAARTQIGWARHTVACLDACRGFDTASIENMGKGSLLRLSSPKTAMSVPKVYPAIPVPGEPKLSIEARRLAFRLPYFLARIGQEALLSNVVVDEVGEGEYSFLLKGIGIGIDVGTDVRVASLAGHIKRYGFRVFTMEVVPGGRNHPDEDHDVTRLETLSMDEALTCVGQLVAQDALNYLPPLPEALAYEEQVEEPAW